MESLKGLIIKSAWVNLILEGKKVWEIRGSNTKIRGEVSLIKSGSGLVIGKVTLSDSIKLSLKEYKLGSAYHCVDSKDNHELPYKNTYAWVLEKPEIYEYPIPYKHPMGAVIWVDLSKAVSYL